MIVHIPTILEIERIAFCSQIKMSKVDFLNKSRNQNIVIARHIFCHKIRDAYKGLITLKEIGDFLDKHYSTIVSSINTSKDIYEFDSGYRKYFDSITLNCFEFENITKIK